MICKDRSNCKLVTDDPKQRSSYQKLDDAYIATKLIDLQKQVNNLKSDLRCLTQLANRTIETVVKHVEASEISKVPKAVDSEFSYGPPLSSTPKPSDMPVAEYSQKPAPRDYDIKEHDPHEQS
jgi:hypothetical protein